MGSSESRVPTSTRTQVIAPTLLDRNSSKHLPLRDEEQPQAAPEVERLTATASQPQVEGGSWKYTRLLDEEQPEARDEPERNEKEIVATLGWVKDLPKDGHGDYAPYKVDVPSSQFTLLKAVELRTSSVSHLRLHAFADNDKTWHLRLTDTDRILGFRFHEVQDAMGTTRHYNPQVLVQNGTSLEVTLEPVSGHIFWPEPHYPGRVQWMPLPAKPTVEQHVKTSEVVGLRCMQGQDREGRELHHLIGVKHQSGFSILQMTGQTAMYWVDLLVLTMALFYADIAFDVKQLVLFYQQGLWDYLLINAIGMMAPPISTCCAAFVWLQHESREVQHFRRLVPSHAMQVVVLLVLILTQTHMIFLVLFSVVFRGKHPMLESAKAAEVAESLTSCAVQGSFMLSYMAGLDFISGLDVTSKQLQSMAISIAISCASLGLNFASRDKKDRAILGLPGKVGWNPVMGALVMVRAMEVASRLAAFNIIHLSWRSHALAVGHLGGPAAAAAMCIAAKLSFANAELPEVLAAVVAHPGQILEPRSVLPLRRSMALHLVLSAAALVSQWQLHCHQAWLSDGAKVLPEKFMVAWLATTAGALLGLSILSLAGWYLEQPIFTELGGKAGSMAFSAVSTAFPSKAAALAAIPDDLVIDLTTEAAVVNLDEEAIQELITAQCALAISKSFPSHFWTQLAGACIRTMDFSGCFEKKGEGSEDLLQVLRHCEALKELKLGGCAKIPGTAWAKVRGAQWPNLQKADFSECFGEQGEGSEDLLQVLRHCEALKELKLGGCQQIPGTAWAKVRGAQWPNLQKADFCACFGEQGEGSEDLLQVLQHCEALKELKLRECEKIPGTAWAKVRGAQWPNLQKADFCACFDEEGEGAEDLLQVLAQCEALEELKLGGCQQIPGTAWAKVRGAQWPNLQKADFCACFCNHGDGAEDLLQVLGRCHALEAVDFEDCDQIRNEIPASAWQQLPDGCWPKLFWCRGIPKEHLQRLRGQGSTGADAGDIDDAVVAAAGSTVEDKACWNALSFRCQGGSCHLLAGPSRSTIAYICNVDAPEEASEVVPLLGALRRCPLEELHMPWCSAAGWAEFQGAQWTNLRIADFRGCFEDHGEGAEDLLQVLARCGALEELKLFGCQQIPGPAWAKVRDAQWPKLKKTNFFMCFDKQGDGAEDLLQGLAQCESLEELDLNWCKQIPGPAWAKARGAQWHQLKKADFSWCFWVHGEGAEDLLQVLARCEALEALDLNYCDKIPASAWRQLPDGCWPKLGDGRAFKGIPEEHLQRLRGQGTDVSDPAGSSLVSPN